MTNRLVDESDAAYLRRVFSTACTTYPVNIPMPEEFRRWWSSLYAAITNTEAGLSILAEIEELKSTVRSLSNRVAEQSDLLSRRAERDTGYSGCGSTPSQGNANPVKDRVERSTSQCGLSQFDDKGDWRAD